MNRSGGAFVNGNMWEDRRLLAAIAALPPEAFVDGAPADWELVWRRALKRMRAERSGGRVALDPGHIAPVIPLHRD